MAGFFLTTAALRISLLWREGPLASYVRGIPAAECWVSPVSHAILKDEFFQHVGMTIPQAKLGMRAVIANSRQMLSLQAQYPYPDAQSLEIWGQIRSVDIVIPQYDDGTARHPEQIVGPDELLVFASAAANLKPLLGPAPTDPETLQVLAELGITFIPSSVWL